MRAYNKFLLTSLVAIIAGCTKLTEADKQVLTKTDLEFADMAHQIGVGAAFIAYADSNAIIMQNGQLPLKGIANIASLHKNTPTDLKLSWHPEKVEVASSGDLGYTFGKYTLTHMQTTEHGHYVTIWKKDKSGKWKYVLDTGTKSPDADNKVQ
ncbi:DUF4440 domain-containing protein [Fulvivirga sp. 29W222]|uniref:DUF4440 domain-containing protein n=1 Tax=Fulvivirga marina TaxID=2494733 RepID=A0A937KEL5_9BACT|nr:DUF4440 domain-containing protein [Fulvivirga marina]MBL6447275.1 DUF4440 domain-containing protein [Fulvivirga marina]